ncbi:hypothetical protein C8R45DRAFT_920256 [Mycena sanguinolenta]|nr:hypothetical protein C8R45DRAFT_920256 [Mycena sanguinolenta]
MADGREARISHRNKNPTNCPLITLWIAREKRQFLHGALGARSTATRSRKLRPRRRRMKWFRIRQEPGTDLQREIQLHKRSGVTSLRRLHSAQVEGKASDVTVAVYQGDCGEEFLTRIPRNGDGMLQDIWLFGSFYPHIVQRHRQIEPSHPNIVQLYGTMSCGDIHAAVFHDGLACNFP